jgi:phage-related holin
MKFAAAATLAFISQITFVPTFSLLLAMAFALGLDFLTGVYKARRKNEATTSKGFRKTIDKFISYGVAVASSSLLVFISEQKGGEAVKLIGGFLNDGLVCFIIYIEVVSIFENLIEISPDSPLCLYFFGPVHKFLTLQIKKTAQQIEAAANAGADTATN